MTDYIGRHHYERYPDPSDDAVFARAKLERELACRAAFGRLRGVREFAVIPHAVPGRHRAPDFLNTASFGNRAIVVGARFRVLDPRAKYGVRHVDVTARGGY